MSMSTNNPLYNVSLEQMLAVFVSGEKDGTSQDAAYHDAARLKTEQQSAILGEAPQEGEAPSLTSRAFTVAAAAADFPEGSRSPRLARVPSNLAQHISDLRAGRFGRVICPTFIKPLPYRDGLLEVTTGPVKEV